MLLYSGLWVHKENPAEETLQNEALKMGGLVFSTTNMLHAPLLPAARAVADSRPFHVGSGAPPAAVGVVPVGGASSHHPRLGKAAVAGNGRKSFVPPFINQDRQI